MKQKLFGFLVCMLMISLIITGSFGVVGTNLEDDNPTDNFVSNGDTSYPDYTITSFSTEPVYFEGYKVPGFREILFTVKNIGDASAPIGSKIIKVYMVRIGSYDYTWEIEAINKLKPGESFIFNSKNYWHGGSPVGSSFTFFIDSENAIYEGPNGEDNNQDGYAIPYGINSKVKSYSILERLLELFPNTFPILRLLLKL